MSTENHPRSRPSLPWRKLGWSTAVALLILPFAAMRLNVEGVDWSPGDFLFAALIFSVVGMLIELAARASTDAFYRAGVALAVFAGLFMIWSNLAVGIIGSEHNPANRLFYLVPVLALGGSALSRFRPSGMAKSMLLAGVTVLLVPVLAYLFAIGDLTGVTDLAYMPFVGIFAVMWFGAAGLLALAARAQPSS